MHTKSWGRFNLSSFIKKITLCECSFLRTGTNRPGPPSIPFLPTGLGWHTVGQIPQKCKETSNLVWLSFIWFILFLFVCRNLFCTIANLRIKCVIETKSVPFCFIKILNQVFYIPHTFDFELSLHCWLLWSNVWLCRPIKIGPVLQRLPLSWSFNYICQWIPCIKLYTANVYRDLRGSHRFFLQYPLL